MDEYLDTLFSSSSWSDVDAKERTSWDCSEHSQPNGLLPCSLGTYEDDKKISPIGTACSNHNMGNLAAQDTSSFVLGGESNYDIDKGLLPQEAQPQTDGQKWDGNTSTNGIMNGSLKVGNKCLQYDAAIPVMASPNLGSSRQVPEGGDLTPSLSFTEELRIGCNGGELSEYHRSLGNLETLSPIPSLWAPPAYEGVSSLSPVTGQDRMQGFVLQGGNMDDIDIIGNRYVRMEKILQLDKLSALVTSEGKQALQNYPLTSFVVGPQATVTTNVLPSLPQTHSATSTGGCNGTGKPRARARRGQATDPHSIAERLRREKIAERMKNLQELVPNSNKTDKASMLDEIIEYVKFLQLQVKVLSMSRLGAAGAVVPLITDGQAEGSSILSLSPSTGQGVDIAPSPDQIAFEQEVVKLMESNMAMAMQYLQSKGLCLIPIALAAAISSGKTSLSGSAAEERKKFGFINGLVHNSSSSSSSSSSTLPGIETHPMSSDDTRNGKLNGEGIMINGCNGAVKSEKLKPGT